MKVTAKGQVTIPFHFREKTGMLPGCEVEFAEDNGRLILRKSTPAARGQEIVRRMAGKGSGKMSTNEILALTRGE